MAYSTSYKDGRNHDLGCRTKGISHEDPHVSSITPKVMSDMT